MAFENGNHGAKAKFQPSQLFYNFDFTCCTYAAKTQTRKQRPTTNWPFAPIVAFPHSNLSIANRLRTKALSAPEISILLRSDRHVDRVPLNQMPAWGDSASSTPRMQMAVFGASRPLPHVPAKIPSLSRPVSSSGLMTSCCHPLALRLMTPHEALASLRGRRQAAS